MSYSNNTADLENSLSALRERRQRLAYDLQFSRGELSDPGRRDSAQIEIAELDRQIRVYEIAISKNTAVDPMETVNARLDVLTRIVQGDKATGYMGIREVVSSLDALVKVLDKRVSQLFLAFAAMVALSTLSILGQIVLLLRFTG